MDGQRKIKLKVGKESVVAGVRYLLTRLTDGVDRFVLTTVPNKERKPGNATCKQVDCKSPSAPKSS